MKSNYETINKLYDRQSYLDKYMVDVLITIIVCGTIIYYIFKNRIKKEIHDINMEWDKHKCKPHYMPFAGFMSESPGDNVYDKTMKNFKQCLSGIIDTNVSISLVPISKTLGDLFETFVEISDMLGTIRFDMNLSMFKMSSVFGDIMKKLYGIVLELVKTVINVKSIIGQLHGTLISCIYALIATYYTSVSGFMFMSDTLYTFIMVTFIYVSFALMTNPFTFSVGLGIFLQGALLSVPLVFLNTFIKQAFGIQMTKMIPSMPGKKKKKKCFSGDTHITMKDGHIKAMCDIIVDDVLMDGSIVTSTTISTNDCSFVNINGVVVTTNHPILYDNIWMESQRHPLAIPTSCNSDYVYCIGTSRKTIKINGYIFSDWDELNESDLPILSGVVRPDENDTLSLTDVHKYFDTGFRKGTLVTLNDGRIIGIEHIKTGDILKNGNMVSSIVKVKSSDLDYFSYYHDDIHLFDATSNLYIYRHDKTIRTIKCTPPDISYHMVTSDGMFHISKVEVGDYNKGIEQHFPKSRWN